MCVCVCVCHLAEECGLELCCGVAGIKKLAKGHLEERKEGINACISFLYCSREHDLFLADLHQILYITLCVFGEKCLTGGGTVLYRTQKTAAIRPMSLAITRAVSGAETERIL